MDIRARTARRLTLRAVLSASFVTLVATSLAAQSAPTVPFFPAAPEGCRVWEAHVLYVIEKQGTSHTALGEALNRAYAMYSKCVMGGCDMNGTEAVAVLEGIRLVLERGRAVASADP